MSSAYIGYVLKDGSVKTVIVKFHGDLDDLGIELNEYFKDLSDVEDIVKTAIKYIEDGEIYYLDDLQFLTEDEYEYYDYPDKDSFIEDMDSDTFYYLFENNSWMVCKPNGEFKELETVLEEEY